MQKAYAVSRNNKISDLKHFKATFFPGPIKVKDFGDPLSFSKTRIPKTFLIPLPYNAVI